MPGTYPFDATTLAAIARLSVSYNGNAYNASTNPYGMAYGGHTINFVPSLQDLATSAQGAGAAATAGAASASAAATSEANAALSAAKLSGTSTTSVAIATGSKSFTTQASKMFDAGTWLRIYSAADPTTQYMEGQSTSYAGTALVVNVTAAVGSATRTDWVIAVAGSPGVQGTIGATGAQGVTAAVQMTFSTGTGSTDPGSGVFNFDNATVGSITRLYIDNVDAAGNTITTWLDAFDDSTNTALRGTLYFRQLTDPTKWMALNVTGAVTDSSGFRTVIVSGGVGVLPANNTTVGIAFARTGDVGLNGAGAGDMVSIETLVVDGDIILWNGTTGKSAKTAAVGIGTSGAKLGKLDAAVTYSGSRTFAATADVQQQFKLSGDISPTQIAANTDDYAPTNIATSSVLRLTTDASRNLTGITGGADGRVLLLINVGSNKLVLKDETTSTAGNRFAFGADVTLGAKQSAWIWYDTTSSRWRLGHPMIAGTSGHTVGYLDGVNTWSGAQSFAAKVDVQQDCYLSGDISPAQITANQNDYNPAGLSTASVLRLTTDALRTITGLQGGADGRIVTIINVGATALVLANADTGSAAANRFLFGVNLTLNAEQSARLWYDATTSRWRAEATALGTEVAFTPGLTFGGAAVGMTGTFTGSYTKIGRVVTGTINITLTAKGSSTGTMGVTGLPFMSASPRFPVSIYMDGMTITAGYQFVGRVASGSTEIEFALINAGNAAAVTDANFGNTSVLLLGFTYHM